MSFSEAMERLFPLSFEAEDWLDTTQVILGARGFTKENSLACISACRDILAVDVVAQVNEKWADSNGNFPVINGSSIAGFMALGKTGMRTLLENAPPGYDRDRFVFIAMPHLAINEGGQLGSPEGMLGRFRKELEQHNVSLHEDPLDSEYCAAKTKLLQKHNFGPVPSLATLTKTAATIASETLDALIKETISLETADVSVLVGVQVRGPNKRDYVYTHEFYSYKDRQKMDHKVEMEKIYDKSLSPDPEDP